MHDPATTLRYIADLTTNIYDGSNSKEKDKTAALQFLINHHGSTMSATQVVHANKYAGLCPLRRKHHGGDLRSQQKVSGTAGLTPSSLLICNLLQPSVGTAGDAI